MPGTSSSTTWPTSAGAPPLFATPRDPSRPNEGGEIAAVARSLGTPLLPWQQYVADVATERLEDGSYAYEVVVVSVPRQTGKTTLIRAMGVHRAAVLGRHVYYTAQTGKDARARWADLKDSMVVSPVWGDRVHVVLRGGAECVHFHHKDGPGFHCFAPVEKCLHGSTPAVVVLDEAFAHDAAKGEMLMGAITPAQQTILARQLWIVSTMGTAESTFFHDWIERAREGSPRVALFLWGADDPAEPYSLEGIAGYHPGVGFLLNERVLTAADVLGEVEKMTKSEYVRAFGNLRTLTTSNLIPVDVWRELFDPSSHRPATPASSPSATTSPSTDSRPPSSRPGRPTPATSPARSSAPAPAPAGSPTPSSSSPTSGGPRPSSPSATAPSSTSPPSCATAAWTSRSSTSASTPPPPAPSSHASTTASSPTTAATSSRSPSPASPPGPAPSTASPSPGVTPPATPPPASPWPPASGSPNAGSTTASPPCTSPADRPACRTAL
jgi:hypothetical protein